MIKDRSQAIISSRWFMPLFCLGLGIAVLGRAGWAASWVPACFRWRSWRPSACSSCC